MEHLKQLYCCQNISKIKLLGMAFSLKVKGVR